MRGGAVPDRVLLGAGQHGDGLDQLGVGGQRPVRVQVGTQHVGQEGRVPMVRLAAGDRVPVPVAGHGHRVDGVDRAAGGAQACGQQPAGGLDGHRDRVIRGVAVLGEQGQQLGQARCVVADAAAGQQLAVPVHQGDVVVVLGPVDAAVHLHGQFALLPVSVVVLAVRAGLSRAGHARSLMDGLEGTAIRLAVRDPGCPQAPVLARARGSWRW